MRRYMFGLCLVTVSLAVVGLRAQASDDASSPRWLLPVPELNADPKIPTIEQVVGHNWAEDVSSHAQIERYLRALVDAAPDRARLETYGKTYEGRQLYYVIISSPENMRRLQEIRRGNLRLADPRRTPPEEAQALMATVPGLVWLAYGIHGNESSSSDAALITAYHLLADRRDETAQALKRLVVFIDPLQNPDGRERFINVHRETRGVFPQADPWASEHTERWPGGRFNHYLFDMNRDWFLQSQAETQGKVAAYLHWHPQIYIDAHEMGRDNTYYFDPPMDPINDLILVRQREWFFRLGRHQAERFDQYGFPYTTREMFDAFYPGYGSVWPTMHGGIGVLWEQAGVRGLVVNRSDETQLHYHQAVRHHYVSGLATIEVASQYRAKLLEDFYQARARGMQLGHEGPVRHFFLLEGGRKYRAARLARLLVDNGIEVRRMTSPLRAKTSDTGDAESEVRTIPAGSYHIAVAQPAGRLARILLDRHTDMGEEFKQRQIRRLERRLRDEIYDVTAWSLPLAFGISCLATEEAVEVDSVPWDSQCEPGEVLGGPAKVAYLAAGDDDASVLALASWLRSGYRVHVADQPLKLAGVDFPRGTLILRVHENPESLHQAVQQAAHGFGLRIYATDTGFVTEGAHLGGPQVRWVRPPRVAMLVDRPARYSVGHTWYLFDQVLRYPVTRVAGRNLGRLDLTRYDVLILPDGNYSGAGAPSETVVRQIKEWVRRGGTLILVKGAASWGTGEKVGLLSSQVVKKPVEPSGEATSSAQAPSGAPPQEPGSSPSDQKATEPPDPVPGAFLRASVYDDHWVTFGCGERLDVMLNGNLILSPLKPTDGRTLVRFASDDRLLQSGFCWPKTLKLLAGKPYVLYQASGEGHVIGFADDPNYRAMYPALQRLFLNAVLFGPGH